MIIVHNIKNRTFKPITIYDIKYNFLDNTKDNTSDYLIVNDVSPGNFILKPFDSKQFLISAKYNPKYRVINDLVYNDLTIITDSTDYGTFFYSFPINLRLKRNFIGVEL